MADAETMARIRAKVEDGKIPVGSEPHLRLIQFDLKARGLNPRDRKIVLLSVRGYSQMAISSMVGLSRSRVSQILAGFFR